MIINTLMLIIASFFTDITYSEKLMHTYRLDFERLMGVNTSHIKIIMTDSSSFDKDNVGVCYRFINTIYINKDAYINSSDIFNKALVYHELMHCVYNTSHDNKPIDSNCSASIMNEFIPTTECLTKHWDLYILDLISKQTK